MELSLTARGSTHIGRVRANNQDSFLVDPSHGLLIVADGMGGHAGGEIASKLAIEKIKNFVTDRNQPETQNAFEAKSETATAFATSLLSDAINHASQSIYERALEEPSLKGMGTTATVAKLRGGQFLGAHVGDSRLYLLRCGLMYQITYDHSLVQEQVRAGLISKEDAEHHHLRNVITRSVGYQEEEEVDSFSIDCESGDYVLLCSDGLHGKVLAKEMAANIKSHGLKAVEALIDLANERGGDDNITVVIGLVS